MTGIADREWESMLDRIDLDVSDAELAAAEQKLQDLAPEELAPVRTEWLEATVAKVRAEAAARAVEASPAPIHKLTLVRRLQRFAAAAAAVVGIHSAATAATVATVSVVAVTAAVVIWKAGVFSYKTMSFRDAIAIQLRADQPPGDRVTALTLVYNRVQATIEALERVRDNAQSPSALVDGARQSLTTLESQLLGATTAEQGDAADVFKASLALLENRDESESLRARHLQILVAASQTGIAAMIATPRGVAEVDEARTALLAKLLQLSRR